MVFISSDNQYLKTYDKIKQKILKGFKLQKIFGFLFILISSGISVFSSLLKLF
jgi:hypothetical protein